MGLVLTRLLRRGGAQSHIWRASTQALGPNLAVLYSDVVPLGEHGFRQRASEAGWMRGVLESGGDENAPRWRM